MSATRKFTRAWGHAQSLLLVIVLILSSSCAIGTSAGARGGTRNNKYPIVLVHGFAGWGRNELLGFKYWGGFHGDYEQQLRDQGHEVYTATVGPLSSNWDRACELYAQIKGGTVHYGANHAKRHGHNVTGRTFPGLYPPWGQVIDGQVQKIHLIGHSMGGQTARMLAQLLQHGSKGAPVEEDPASHELFAGGKDWIHSITTVASPNQGTLLADGLAEVEGGLKTALAGFLGLAGAAGGGLAQVYDFKLDHWGVAPKQLGESMLAYVQRVFSSSMFRQGFADISLHSLSSAGARAENQWVRTLPSIYYFSYSTQDSFPIGRRHFPRPLSMLAPLQPLSLFLGSKFALERGLDVTWQRNDGVVNTPSMRSDGQGPVITGGASIRLGHWHDLGTLTTMDHEAIVGVKLLQNAFGIYEAHTALLADLPVLPLQQQPRRLVDPGVETGPVNASVAYVPPVQLVSAIDAVREKMNADVDPEAERAMLLAMCLQTHDDIDDKQAMAGREDPMAKALAPVCPELVGHRLRH